MPYSVTMAVMREWSVTSNAGLYTSTPAGAMDASYHMWVTSSGGRCSMGMAVPLGQVRSMVEVGATT